MNDREKLNIKELKKKAKGDLKRNYWGIVITCAIVALVLGTFINPASIVNYISNPQNSEIEHHINPHVVLGDGHHDGMSNTEIVDEFLGGIGMDNSASKKWTAGALSSVIRNTEGSNSFVFGVINSINQFAFEDKISPGIIISLGVLAEIMLMVFFKNVLAVGYCRYFLEVRRYSKTKINRILFPWHIKRGRKIAKVMFFKMLYQYLWDLTIVGGIIKSYSYRMVPYIAAENPDMTPKEVIDLSRKMMDGRKWQTFLLDITFVPWWILNIMTLNFLGILFLNPYIRLTNAELYMSLREEVKRDNIENSDKLCDRLLSIEYISEEYPVNEYMIPPHPSRKWVNSDYNRDYSITSLILIFFSFAFIGWVWEVGLFLFQEGRFINRGLSYGPWLPIYGVGGVAVLVLLKRLRARPWLTFLTSTVLCGIVEYFTSWFLEMSKGMRWWDYSGYFLNLNGRICLEGLLVFGFGCCAAIYLIAPELDDLFEKIPKKIKVTLCVVLVSLFLMDEGYAYFVPNIGKGITDYK